MLGQLPAPELFQSDIIKNGQINERTVRTEASIRGEKH